MTLAKHRSYSSGVPKAVWDGSDLLLETDAENVTQVVYTSSEQLISQRLGGSAGYFHTDPLGSVACMTDGAGDLTDVYHYSSFGKALSTSGDTTNPFRFLGSLGYYTDPLLLYVRRRYYNPRTARWLACDPVGLGSDNSNLYLYVANNPATQVDPSGLRIGCVARCRRVLRCTFIGGRGEFTGISFTGETERLPGETMQEWLDRRKRSYQSQLSFEWNPEPSEFLEPNGKQPCCCCCTSVGLIQIARTAVVLRGRGPAARVYCNFIAAQNSFDWHIDKTHFNPFSPLYNGRTINPCENVTSEGLAAFRLDFEDSPGIRRTLHKICDVKVLDQQFEVCVYCMAGIERGAIYGCLKWGHHFGKSYTVRRWVENVEVTDPVGAPADNRVLDVPNRTGATPSSRFVGEVCR